MTTHKGLYRGVFFFVIVSASLYICQSFGHSVNDVIAIRVKHQIDLADTTTGQMVSLKDSVDIIYIGEHTIYKIPRLNIFSSGFIDKDGNEVKSDYKETITYFYIIANKNKAYGYRFDTLALDPPKKVAIDSFLTNSLFKNFPFYMKSNDSLLKTMFNNTKTAFKEFHVCKIKRDKTFPDSMYYSFNAENNSVPFSFSTYLDSTRQSKLSKVEFVYSPFLNPANKLPIPRRLFAFEISRNPDDISAVKNFIAKLDKSDLYK